MRSSPEVQQSHTKRPLFSRNVGKIAQRAARDSCVEVSCFGFLASESPDGRTFSSLRSFSIERRPTRDDLHVSILQESWNVSSGFGFEKLEWFGVRGGGLPSNSCMFEAEKIAQFRSKAERKNSSCSSVKIAEFWRLRSETNSCMFEAENSLNFALKQPLRSIEITAACSRLKSDQLRSKTTSLRSREITAACSRLKNFAQLRSETTSSIQRGITAACSRLKNRPISLQSRLFCSKNDSMLTLFCLNIVTK